MPKKEINKAFKDVEFTRPADKLVGIVKKYYEQVHGVVPTRKQLLEDVNAIIEERV